MVLLMDSTDLECRLSASEDLSIVLVMDLECRRSVNLDPIIRMPWNGDSRWKAVLQLATNVASRAFRVQGRSKGSSRIFYMKKSYVFLIC
jgi:hypothetical protein